MDYQLLKIEKKEGLATVRIDSPQNLNALSEAILLELRDALAALDEDPEVRVVCLTGSGRSFIAGGDVAEMAQKDSAGMSDYAHLARCGCSGLEDMRKPVIAAINGFCFGGGVEYALACDFRIASTKAKLGLPEVGLGIIPGCGGTQRLPKIVGRAKAMELILTAKTIGADEALACGLVNAVAEPEALEEAVFAFAKPLLKMAPLALAAAKECILKSDDLPIHAGLTLEQQKIAQLFKTEDRREGMQAFLEKRSAKFSGK